MNHRHPPVSDQDLERLLADALQARWPARVTNEIRLAKLLAAAEGLGHIDAPARRLNPVFNTIAFAAALAALVLLFSWLFQPDPQQSVENGPLEVEVPLDDPEHRLVSRLRLAPVDSQWDGYGEAVDLRGDLLVIGASEWNTLGAGSAYVYRLVDGSWQQEAHLTASDGNSGQHTVSSADRFGDSVALGDGLIAIGAPGVDDPVLGENSGAVYVFERRGSAWVETARITADSPVEIPAPVAMDEFIKYGRLRPRAFGAKLAISGDTLAVGGDPAGRIFLFQLGGSGWEMSGQIQLPARPDTDYYLAGMSLYGDSIALSVFYAMPGPEQASVWKGQVVVFVFERTGGEWARVLQYEPEQDAGLLFFDGIHLGASVALGGDGSRANRLAVGLPGFPDWSEEDENAGMFGAFQDIAPDFPFSPRQAGGVYLFDRGVSGWSAAVSLIPAGATPPPGPGEIRFAGRDLIFPGRILSERPEVSFFGATVDLDGDQLAVTSSFSNATYVFRWETDGWHLAFGLQAYIAEGGVWEDYAQTAAISGLNLALGTPGEFGNSAYTFRLCSPADPNCR